MRHKYETLGIVLSRSPAGETNANIALITPGLGLIYARAQGVRHSGAKLAAALVTFAESELVLVHGMEQWRVVGAVLKENWFLQMRHPTPRARAARVCGLLLRLIASEISSSDLFWVMHGFFGALATLSEDMHEAAEALAVLRLLAILGLDTGEIQGSASEFTPSLLAMIAKKRTNFIARINRGITASGL